MIFGIVELVIVAGIIGFFIFRKQNQVAEKFHPNTVQNPTAFTSRIEALLLALLAGTVLFFQIAAPNSDGNLMRPSTLEKLSEGAATGFMVGASIAAVIVLLGVILAARGRTVVGTVLTLLALAGFGMCINITTSYSNRSNPVVDREAVWTFELTDDYGASLPGVDLYAGETHVGKTPLTIDIAEFWEKFGTEASKKPEGRGETPRFLDRDGRETSAFLLVAAQVPKQSGPQFNDFDWERCYFRAELAGRPVYGGGGSSGSGGGRGFGTSSGVHAPDRATKLRNLVTQLRLNSYQMDDDWLSAFDSFGESGKMNLRRLATTELGIRQVLDKLTDREIDARFGVPKKPDAKTAQAKFESLLDHIDGAQKFSTDSLEGIAIERLAPHLDQDWLVGQAERFLRHRGNQSYGWGTTTDGAPYFSGSLRFQEDGQKYLPLRTYAIAHAIWATDRHLDETTGGEDHDFQNRIVSTILKWRYGSDDAFKWSRHIGGSTYQKFAGLQDWRTVYDENDIDYHQKTSMIPNMGSKRANTSFLQRINLDTTEGAKVREESRERMFALMNEGVGHSSTHPLLDAIFLDGHLGEKSPAAEYWPRFKANFTKDNDWDVPGQWFDYLVRMEPYPTPEMYAQTIQEIYDLKRKSNIDAIELEMGKALNKVKKLPVEKRAPVLKAMKAEYLKLAELTDDNHLKGQLRDHYTRQIDTELAAMADTESISRLLSSPYEGNVARHLKQQLRSPKPIIAQMLEHENPLARIDALNTIRERPTPEYRELFFQQKDREEDEDVQEAMANIEAEWENILQLPLAEVSAEM